MDYGYVVKTDKENVYLASSIHTMANTTRLEKLTEDDLLIVPRALIANISKLIPGVFMFQKISKDNKYVKEDVYKVHPSSLKELSGKCGMFLERYLYGVSFVKLIGKIHYRTFDMGLFCDRYGNIFACPSAHTWKCRFNRWYKIQYDFDNEINSIINWEASGSLSVKDKNPTVFNINSCDPNEETKYGVLSWNSLEGLSWKRMDYNIFNVDSVDFKEVPKPTISLAKVYNPRKMFCSDDYNIENYRAEMMNLALLGYGRFEEVVGIETSEGYFDINEEIV